MKFSSNHKKESFSLEKLSLLDDRNFRLMFSKSPIKRIGRDRFLRNVLIALGNSKSKSAAHYIKETLVINLQLSGARLYGQLIKF